MLSLILVRRDIRDRGPGLPGKGTGPGQVAEDLEGCAAFTEREESEASAVCGAVMCADLVKHRVELSQCCIRIARSELRRRERIAGLGIAGGVRQDIEQRRKRACRVSGVNAPDCIAYLRICSRICTALTLQHAFTSAMET